MGSSPVASTNGKDKVFALSFLFCCGKGLPVTSCVPNHTGVPALNDVFPCGQEKLKGMFSYESDEKRTDFSVDALLSILSNLFDQVFNRTIKSLGEFV